MSITSSLQFNNGFSQATVITNKPSFIVSEGLEPLKQALVKLYYHSIVFQVTSKVTAYAYELQQPYNITLAAYKERLKWLLVEAIEQSIIEDISDVAAYYPLTQDHLTIDDAYHNSHRSFYAVLSEIIDDIMYSAGNYMVYTALNFLEHGYEIEVKDVTTDYTTAVFNCDVTDWELYRD